MSHTCHGATRESHFRNHFNKLQEMQTEACSNETRLVLPVEHVEAQPTRHALLRVAEAQTKKSGMSSAPGTLAYFERSVTPAARRTSSSTKN